MTMLNAAEREVLRCAYAYRAARYDAAAESESSYRRLAHRGIVQHRTQALLAAVLQLDPTGPRDEQPAEDDA